MSLVEAQQVPMHAKPRHINPTIRQQKARSMGSLAVDPVLLYAKLEAAKQEQDKARRAAQDRKSHTKQEQQHGAQTRSAPRERRSTQKESLRRSLPLEAEWTADGKPCYNTAKILAALDETPQRHASTSGHSRHAELLRRREDGVGTGSDSDVKPAPRRRFKSDDTAGKLVAIKHGSQTTYERVDLPGNVELLENMDDELTTRPRLSKYDRPHWAQQSQNAVNMRSLKHALPGSRYRRSRVPPETSVPSGTGDARPDLGERHSSHDSETLIADAVNEIHKEQRLKKLRSVSKLFRRSAS
ncbi:hypothetical protein AMS68_002803 [Peltaster fructicola]|uniref:Uncharacterized protein n=1 Tax=Peltaster fructicola TaxID=286661 RepID=A0A6H0XRH1_9PEZI|nr:hypothetical protein AMS68_002803 [Peltaster fructicola]